MRIPPAIKVFLLYSWRPWSKPEKEVKWKITFDNPLILKDKLKLEEEIFLYMKIPYWYVISANEVCVVTAQHVKWMDSIFEPKDLPATIEEVSDGLTKAGFPHKPPVLLR